MIIKSFMPSIKDIGPFIELAISAGNNVKLTVTGFSMYPMLRGNTDDVVLAPPDKLNKYDVVLFKRENGDYIFHRIIKIKGDVMTIAGDNETKKEHPVYSSQIIAKMKSFSRAGREHSTSELWYKIYSRFWLFIFPLRPLATRIFYNTALFLRRFRRGK